MHVVGTAGHVDHGKSTLVRALTGIDPDRFEEEKRRGLTIDLGFAWRTLPSGREIGIVDVPGHERFIRNMLAGAGGIDVALFVVAADEGWMPQSAEHLQVLDFLAVRGGVIALTRSDLVDDELRELAIDDIHTRVRGSVLEGAEIVPVSAVTGAGLEELIATLDALLEQTPEAVDRGRPRLFVDRSFTIAGAGTVVTGTLTGGRLSVGETVHVHPHGHGARIRSLQTHERAVDETVPGSRVAMNLVGLEKVDVQRGDVVTRPDVWLPTDTFAARLHAAASLGHPFTERGAYELYVGSAEIACRVKFLESSEGVAPGASLLVQIFFEGQLPLVPGDRFVIRDVGRKQTVAGGTVIDQAPGRLRRDDAEALMKLREREGLGPQELAEWLIRDRKLVRYAEVERLAGAGHDELAGAMLTAARWGDDGFIFATGHVETLQEMARKVVGEHHRTNPLSAGMPSEELRRAMDVDPEIWPLLMDEMEENNVVVRDGAAVRLRDRVGGLDAQQRQIADAALEKMRDAGTSPPDIIDAGLSLELAKALERAGELVFVTPQIAYPIETWRYIEDAVVDAITRNGPATVSELRETLRTTRKYAVPLLEKLDATGITRRAGDTRELGPRGRDVLAQRT
jgi:selenocysteine-specific elongation factor